MVCSVCAHNKSSNKPPAGLLTLLPVLRCPWSHIALDFITGLPSNDNTSILMVMDGFSKYGQFFPLPKLPSAKEIFKLVIISVFRIHGLPVDIVSDRGSQFTSA